MDKPDIPNGQILKGAPRSIAAIAYGALALLFVAANAASYFKGSASTYLINVVLTAGLFFIVIGFDRIARSKSIFWEWVGNGLLAAVMTAVAAVFICILYYIPTGRPAALNAYFRPDFKVELPQGIKLSSAFLNVVRSAGAEEIPQASSRLYEQYRSKVVGLTEQISSKKVTWQPNVSDDTTLEIAIRRKGIPDFSVLASAIPGQAGSYEIEGLKRGDVYEVRVIANRQGAASNPAILCAGIAADESILSSQPLFPDYLIYSSGEIDCNGTLEGDAKLIYERVKYRDDLALGEKYAKDHDVVPRWIFRGSVKGGKPMGGGSLAADQLECYAAVSCSSECRGEFDQQSITAGQCHIRFPGLVMSENGLSENNVGTIYGSGEYLGHVGKSQSGAISVGPFRTAFNGVGVLQAKDAQYSTLYVGPWINGWLGPNGRREESVDAGSLDWFKVGLLDDGWSIDNRGCSLSASKGDGSARYRVSTDCLSVDVQSPSAEFSLRRSGDGQAFNGRLRIGNQSHTMKTTRVYDEVSCFWDDEFGVPKATEPLGWKLQCDPYERACSLADEAETIKFRASYPLNAAVKVQVSSKLEDLSKLALDGRPVQTWSMPASGKDHTLAALLTLSRMCGGGTLSSFTGKSTVVSDPCRPAATMFARLMQCALRARATQFP